MRSKTIFGALLVSVALCSQGFGFELLDRMLGLNCGGCGDCNACANVACCDKACVKACCPEPACCEKACCDPACCEEACCSKCKKCRITPVRDLFAGLVDLFECKGCYCEPVCGSACCEEAACCEKPDCCDEVNCCKKKCRKPRRSKKNCCCEAACDPACEKVAACDPTCEPTCKPKCHKLYRRPVIELLEALFGSRNCRCGEASCGDGCETACGSGGVVPGVKAPAKAPEKAAPLPMAPKADPSAAIHTRGIYQASRSLVRN